MKRTKNKTIKLVKIFFFSILSIIIILFLFWQNLDLFLKFNYFKKTHTELTEKIKLNKEDIVQAEINIKKIETQFGVEKFLFEKLSLQKPGEKVIEILE